MPFSSLRLRHPRRHVAEAVDRARVFDTLLNNLEGMAYRCLFDAQWSMVFVSQGSLALTGYAPDELCGNTVVSWEHITHPHDRARVRAVVGEAVQTGLRFSVEYHITTRDGQTRRVVERGVAVRDEQGERVIEGFIEDITQRQATLEALEHAELRYRHIFEHASEGIFQTTREGRYLAANPALARIYGYATPQELMADLSDIEHRLYVHAGRREVFHRLMKAQGQVLNFESEVFRRDGTRIWISENAHIVLGAQKEFLC
ncbi:MAG: PAS domain-containing protein, partial [Giesbergeria sp.]|nr:PAS domain-containing protein [Giesbergeria sp.]